MPVRTCYELPRSASGTGVQAKYVRKFETHWTDGQATTALIASTIGIQYLDPHPENAFALAVEAQHTQDESNPEFWESSYTYDISRRDANEQAETVANPTSRRPRVSGSWESMRVPVPDDTSDPPKTIRNSAGQVPDPRIEVDGDMQAFVVTANVYPLPDWVFTYRSRRGCINNAPFTLTLESGQTINVETGCARLRDTRFSEMAIENGYPYYQISFGLLLRDPPLTDDSQDGWCYDFVHQGMMQKASGPVPESGIELELQHIIDRNGDPVSSPVPLDEDGVAITEPTADDQLYITYENVYAKKTFGGVLPACT